MSKVNNFFIDKAKVEIKKEGVYGPERLVSREDYDLGVTTAVCDIHGEFKVKEIDGLVRIVMSTCQKCAKEYDSIVEKKAIELEQKSINKEIEEMLIRCGVSYRHHKKTFDNFNADNEQKKYALDSVRYFCDQAKEGNTKNIILCGSVGTGKTHLASAVANSFVDDNYRGKSRVRIETVTNIIRNYRATWSKESEETEQGVVDRYSRVNVLVIDELGVQSRTDNEINILFEIINNRYENRLPTMVISNLEPSEVAEILGNRIIDRLKEDGCRVVGMSWDSQREIGKKNFNN